MKRKTHTRVARRWVRRLAVGVAVLAVAVPAAPALGGIPPEPAQPAPVRPDDRATHGVGADVVQATLPNGLTAHDRPSDSTPAVQPAPSDGTAATSGFDWGDAAAGLGVGVGASLVLALAAIGVQRRRGSLADA